MQKVLWLTPQQVLNLMKSMLRFSLRKIDENKELARFAFPSQTRDVMTLKKFLQSNTSFVSRIALKSIETTFFFKEVFLYCSVYSLLNSKTRSI